MNSSFAFHPLGIHTQNDWWAMSDAVSLPVLWSWWGVGGVLIAVLLVSACVVVWAANLLALPGNWGIVALASCYAWLGPEEGRFGMGAGAVGALFLLGLLGEGLEFVAGALGASRAGASRRATIYSIGGSMIGALGGAFVGIPIPLIGPILAALLFGGLGATAGAIYAEATDGKPWRESWVIGRSAFVGRTLGTAAKSLVGLVMVLGVVIAVLV
ncbi:MAG: DUF456 domain-containing protein [Planctomycetota bacterium]